MKKNRLHLVALAIGCLFSTSLCAQTQVIKMTTAKNVGDEMTLVVNRTTAGVTVDWGDGNAIEYPKGDDIVCKIVGNVKGSEITLRGSASLNTLVCEDCQLTALDVSEAANLQSLYCQNNQLTALNINSLTNLVDLDASNNSIESLVANKSNMSNTENINIANNSMTKFGGSTFFSLGGTSMQHINIAGNEFASMFVKSNTNLDALICSYNKLKTLDLSANSVLTTLVCNDNALTKLTTSASAGLPELQQVICDNNAITSLDLSLSSNISDISCANNGMSELSYPSQKLQSMNCGGNSLTFRSLPIAKNMPEEGFFSYHPQTDLDITGLLTKSTEYTDAYYMPMCPSYSDRTNSAYILDLADYRMDGANQPKVTLTPYSLDNGEKVELVKASATDKEQDFTYTLGKFTFLKPFSKVVIELAHKDYPELIISTNVFAVGDGITGINAASLNNESNNGAVYNLQGIRVTNPQGGVYIQNGKKVIIK